MSEKRSDLVWEQWLQGSQKFDYFVAGLSSALTAFVAQSLERAKLGLNATGLEAVSAILFCGAVAAALDRLRFHVAGISANHKELYHREGRGNLVSALAAGKQGMLFNSETGDVFPVADVHKKIAAHERALAQIEQQGEKFRLRAERSYKVRDWLLIGGLVVYVASRIWKAFF